MSRFFVPITVQELKNKIEKFLAKEDGDFNYLIYSLSKDLDKVSFSTENITEEDYTYGPCQSLLGYKTLPNGMPYLGVAAGGDWEYPVFFIIYWDGSKLRGYIPKDGNTWNTDNNRAFGNDDEGDLRNAVARWPKAYTGFQGHPDEIEPIADTKKIIREITQRIVKKENPKPSSKDRLVVKLIIEPALATTEAKKLVRQCSLIPNVGMNLSANNKPLGKISNIEVECVKN